MTNPPSFPEGAPQPGDQQPTYGQPGAPQPPYGAPGPYHPGAPYPYPGPPTPAGEPAYGGYLPPSRPSNWAGITALVVGVVALLTTVTLVGGIGLGILAVVLGFVGRYQASKGRATNGGMSLAGIILGIVSIMISILLIVVGVSLFNNLGGRDLTDCLRDAGTDAAAIQRCQDEFRDNLENRFPITLEPAPR